MGARQRIGLTPTWSYAPGDEAREHAGCAGLRIPADGGVLISDESPARVRILPAGVAEAVGDMARRGEVRTDEVELDESLLRILELEGLIRAVPPGRPPEVCTRQAADDSSVSLSALWWAAAFPPATPEDLTRRLYFYGRRPVSARWSSRLPDEQAVEGWLGLGLLGLEEAGYGRLPRTPDTWVWRRWGKKSSPHPSTKLYVCCVPEELPAVLRQIMPVLARPSVSGFKLGFDLASVLRPDKFVLYLSDTGAADQVAADVAAAAGPVEVQPLPFTAATAAGPLVTRATDPPDWRGRPAWHERASWRLHVCRLAAETLAATGHASPQERVAAVLERLRLAGLNTDDWTWTDRGR
ncbi:hypothetical protein GCM10010259_25070 [Streptomyces daghestanicus]|uniref:Uncharacterized protein n=1 Tax=Streptomyces daghestanicus TaxID=66885 RepID=A0ABQ3QAC0_9ACTN|nr:hypothetical protein GCM10010259_25070 [Streptomyces daghestanicus]GHI34215.1 hypothetical protein Sdagh_59450 [Streptomyces daghestanicus]